MPGMLRPEGTLTDRSVWNVPQTAGFPPWPLPIEHTCNQREVIQR